MDPSRQLARAKIEMLGWCESCCESRRDEELDALGCGKIKVSRRVWMGVCWAENE